MLDRCKDRRKTSSKPGIQTRTEVILLDWHLPISVNHRINNVYSDTRNGVCVVWWGCRYSSNACSSGVAPLLGFSQWLCNTHTHTHRGSWLNIVITSHSYLSPSLLFCLLKTDQFFPPWRCRNETGSLPFRAPKQTRVCLSVWRGLAWVVHSSTGFYLITGLCDGTSIPSRRRFVVS